ncbi:hypothetical protein BJV77DRAFT_968531, partial [Russula vinacea]
MCRAIQGQWAPTKDILGPADVIGRNYFKSTRPIQEHWGYPPKTFWAQLMSSVEASPGLLGPYRGIGAPAKNILDPADGVGRNYSRGIRGTRRNILGPADVIGRHYSKSAEPIQEHRGHPPKQFWAQPMSPVEIIPRASGHPPKQFWAQPMASADIIPSLLGPYMAIGALTENMLGPANVIGRNYSKSAGPIQEHREHPPKQFWAQPMASVDIIPSLLGPYRGIGGTHRNMLGPANVIGRHYSKSAEPIQEHLRNPSKKLWAQQMSS